MNGNRLRIEADVDLKGLQLFRQMLDSYETMLKLLNTEIDLSPAPDIPGESAPE